MYTAIDDVLSLSELEQCLESKVWKMKTLEKKSNGRKKFEKRLVSILNHSSNIKNGINQVQQKMVIFIQHFNKS
ncbi:hypothetical protein JS44_14055 [Anoxybacillus flavithermus]|uniref:Uncharacterized protein n=1 Tax=Anoxybacillus flavithermus TaxID=33934 RepID=A0A094LBH3_9BACL|nr:hypothetical protein JS44_14055 [Anoxybacillus flavithermus]